MVLIGILHVVGIYLYFYWVYWWYDWMLHTLAGVAGGLGVYWFLFDSGMWRRQSDKILLPVLAVAICLLIVGALWEIFELAIGNVDSHEGYRLDVIHDLLADTAGAVLAAWYSVRQTLRNKISE